MRRHWKSSPAISCFTALFPVMSIISTMIGLSSLATKLNRDQVLYLPLWAAAGFDDTDLSFLSFLELYGTEIAERRMPARRVVEALDVVEHI